ncbi:putative MICOS complex subunit MIC60 [Apostichopus japonicus]|uniref:MICOS complex subunit MIC60 n=1 Tax=Stichopus japonicus TaxID=307972 RepID=A0A2G8JI92_STIJA|nr:putative MICOS complex subunit MIC60 [Apostichopus japonicus]
MWKITKQTTLTARVTSRQLVQRKFSKNTQRLQQAEGGSPGVPPPPPPKRSGSGLKILGGGLLIAAGAVGGSIAYAKANPEFRQQVESNWPVLVPLTSYIFKDDDNNDGKSDQKFSLGGLTTSLGRKKEVLPEADIKPPTELEEKKYDEPSALLPSVKKEGNEDGKKTKTEVKVVTKEEKKITKEKQELKRKEKEEAKAKAMEQKLIEQELDDAAEIAALETILDHVMESAVNATVSAIDRQTETVEIIKNHTEKLKVALDTSQEVTTNVKDQQWNEVIKAAEIKKDSQQATDAEILRAREELEKLKSVIEEGDKVKSKFGPSKYLIGAKETLLQMQGDLDEAELTKTKADREARMLRDCHELIEKSREQLKKELASVVPKVKLGQKGAKLSEEELNAIIVYTHQRIEQLHKQLAEQQALEEKRIGLALEKQREEDEQANREQVLRDLERKSTEWAILQERKLSELRQEYEDEMRVQLRRQAAAHSDHLSDVLRVQEKQHAAQTEQREVDVRQEERSRYQEKLNSAMTKLRGVEAAIEGRAHLEKENKKSQELWLACETLKQTITTGKLGGRNWEDKLKPLANEVIAIKEVAGPENQFVNAVVDKIPEEALMRGVFNEDCLRERWENIQRICKRVALIDENGEYFPIFCVLFSVVASLHRFNPPVRRGRNRCE